MSTSESDVGDFNNYESCQKDDEWQVVICHCHHLFLVMNFISLKHSLETPGCSGERFH